MPNDDILDTLRITRSRSVPSCVTATPDGSWMFVSEGGTMALIDVPDPVAGLNQDLPPEVGWVQVGHSGVRATAMALDPEAANPPLDGDSDLLYIAGGRDGLWVMKADTTAWASNVAQRIDDSGNTDPAKQKSRRWCCAVDFMQLGTDRFLLALFAKAGQNRLRVYKLEDARGTFATGEIPPWIDVHVTSHPEAPSSPPAESFGTSAAWAMAVDEVDDTPGQEARDVYMALGHHGLARVRFTTPGVLPLSGDPVAPPVEWGPIFGDGSHYEQGSGIPGWALGEYYGNYEFIRRGTNPGDPFHPHHPGTDVLERTEPPIFADVAVQNDEAGHFLYAAVDHLNWVRFDLEDVWDHQMEIKHHEGVPALNSLGAWEFEVIDPSNAKSGGRMRDIELVEAHPDNQNLGTVLVAAAAGATYNKDQHTPNEGPSYDIRFSLGAALSSPGGAKDRILIYDADGTLTNDGTTSNAWAWAETGRLCIYPPPDQDHADENLLYVFHRTPVEQVCFLALDETGSGGTGVYRRTKNDTRGRKCFSAARSIVHPDLFLFGGNDAGPFPPGIQVEDPTAPAIVAHADPEGDLRPLTVGTVWNPRAQWIREADPLKQYYWTQDGWSESGIPEDNVGHWCWVKAHVGDDPFNANPGGQEPNHLLRWFVAPPDDRFEQTSRNVQMEAELDPLYDVHTRGMVKGEWVFAAHQRPVAEGVVAMRRDVMEEHFETGDVNDKPFPDETRFTLEQFELADPNFDDFTLNTHPEASQIDFTDSAALTWWGKNCPGSETAVYTWRPELVQVDTKDQEDLGSWVLVVPCGMLYMDSGWKFFQDNPEYVPTGIWDANFEHSLVQFWDVTDPEAVPTWVRGPNGDPWSNTNLTHEVDNDSPLPKAIGSADEGMAWRTSSKRVLTNGGQDERVFCFVADFGGRVLVYDIRDILDDHDMPEQILPEYEVWDATPSLYNKRTNPVQGIAVDVVNPGDPDNEVVYVYAAVRRVGIEVLRFHPDELPGSRLERVRRIQTSEEAWELVIEEDSTGTKTLLVSGYRDGFSIYED